MDNPKMVGMSPATPSVGYRFLMAEGIDQLDLMRGMLSAIDQYCQQEQLSCCHLNFVDLPWFTQMPSTDFIGWHHQSYLWKNLNFSCFEDYFKIFNSPQRHNIRRERRRMEKYGIEIRAFTGDDIHLQVPASNKDYSLTFTVGHFTIYETKECV